MHPAYKNDKDLCKWLRENSSGNYRLAAYAADRIETLIAQLNNVQHECELLSTTKEPAITNEEGESVFNKYRNPDHRCKYPFEACPTGYCWSFANHVDMKIVDGEGDEDMDDICCGCEFFKPDKPSNRHVYK
jgi:hypothetical protein